MASSLRSCFSSTPLQPTNKSGTNRHIVQIIRAQSLDEGRSPRNIVDANLSVLRQKMKLVKMKERLEKCCKLQHIGWNYAPGYNYQLRRAREVSSFFEHISLVCVTLGFTCFSGTLCLFLVSIFVHLNQ